MRPDITDILMNDSFNEALTKLHKITISGGHERVREQDVFDKSSYPKKDKQNKNPVRKRSRKKY